MVVAAVPELGIAYFIRAEDFLSRFALAWGKQRDLNKLLPANRLEELQLEMDEPLMNIERGGVVIGHTRIVPHDAPYSRWPRYRADLVLSSGLAYPDWSRPFYRGRERNREAVCYSNDVIDSDYVSESSSLANRPNERYVEHLYSSHIDSDSRDSNRRIHAARSRDWDDEESAWSDSRDRDSAYESEYTSYRMNPVNRPTRSKSYLGSIRDGDSTDGSVSGERRSVVAENEMVGVRYPQNRGSFHHPLPLLPSRAPPVDRQTPGAQAIVKP